MMAGTSEYLRTLNASIAVELRSGLDVPYPAATPPALLLFLPLVLDPRRIRMRT